MKLQRTITLCVVTLTLSLPVVQAQAQNAGPIGPIGARQLPVPAARSLDIESGPDNSPRPQGDTHTLSSIERFGIGALGDLPRFLDVFFHFSESGDTGLAPGTRGSATSTSENLVFARSSSRSHFTGAYTGAQLMYYPNSLYNNYSHTLTLSEEFRSDRWVFRLRHDLRFSKETAIGGLALGGIGLNPNYEINGLQPAAGAGDSILTRLAQRTQNTTSSEINYFLSQRSILTVAGSYTSLNFKDPGFIDSQLVSGRAGYDYLLSAKDRVGLIYDYTQTHFSVAVPRMRTDSVQFAFGRKITGRLAFQFSGGPQQLRFGIYGDKLGWTVSNALSYQTRRTQYSFGYARTSASGSGLFLGASSHTVAATVQHSLSRSWSASANVGYAFNRALAPVDGQLPSFGNWSGNAGLQHVIGRHMQLGLGYGVQQQNTANGACAVANCGAVTFHQFAGATLDWRPFGIGAR